MSVRLNFCKNASYKDIYSEIIWQKMFDPRASQLPYIMAIPVVEFSREGYIIRKVYG
jgi:hypothetical protein